MPGNPTSRWSWLTRERLVLAGLLLFTVAARSSVMIAMRGNFEQDPDAYRRIAENLLADGVFSMDERERHEPKSNVSTPNPAKAPWKTPTAYRPPLYPIVLSNLSTADRQRVSLLKVAAAHVLFGVGTVLLTWLTATRLCRVGATHRVGPASEASAGPPAAGIGGPAPAGADLSHPTILSHPTWLPLLAGLLVACDPILLNQQTLIMTETLATFLTILALWCLARFDGQRAWFNAGLAGGAIGLAILCRPTYLPWLGLVAGAMLLVRGRNFRSQISDFRLKEAAKREPWWRDVGWRAANVAALLIVAGAVVSPWVIRNYRVFGKPIVATTHGGYTLWLGNNASFYDWLRNDESGVPWDVNDIHANTQEGMNDLMLRIDVLMDMRNHWPANERSEEFGTDRLYAGVAYRSIENDPPGFVRASAYRVRQLWSPLPNKLTADESTSRMLLRYATCAWYCGVYLLAAVGIWKFRWKLFAPPFVWGVLLCVTFTAVHTFYWSNLRMRAPLMPFVAIVAAAALTPIARRPVEDQAARE